MRHKWPLRKIRISQIPYQRHLRHYLLHYQQWWRGYVDHPLEFHERPFRQDRLRHDIIGSLALDAMPLTDNEDLAEEEADQIGAVTG